MLKETIKTVIVIVMVLILGAVAGDLDVIESTRIGDWYLPALVRLVTFGAAAFFSLKLALGIGRSETPPVLGSPGLSRITQLLVGAGGIWFLHNGLEVVVGREWRDALNVGTSIFVLALLALVVGVVYTGFEEITASLARLKASGETDSTGGDSEVVELSSGSVGSLDQIRPIADRLTEVESLRAQGLLDEEEYASKRRSILDEV